MTINSDIQEEKPEGITRRNFLTLAGITTIAAPLALKGLESAFYQGLIFGFNNPTANDSATSIALRIGEMAPNSENLEYRPMIDILEEGIATYKLESGPQPFSRRIDDYKGVDYYIDVIDKYRSEHLFPQPPNKLVGQLVSNFPQGAHEAYFQSSMANNSFEELFTAGSGFDKRFRKKHPEFIHKSGLYINNDKIGQIMYEEGKLEINELKLMIEEKKAETGAPVSASYIFAHFLKGNDGDISNSIFDTAIFLKFMARNNSDTGDFVPNENNVNWYRQNIKDEYQGQNYTSTLEDEKKSAINLIGKPYHSWNLVSMLQFLPVEVIRIGGIQKQLSTFSEQGLGKTRADIQTLDDLKKIESFLFSF
ncbi:hypothetical protein CO058_03240 [candidate division WWE3 bacterium CG_4_9_14_0_2_um_filter_35_11]|uniref:Uncharacterized protein n=1 Tax=candidate division WWE3 bacterium CG_4_9_14_0_2_um_filter_35_11 TaxID=1975077 RepID=A0A2M8EL94_UNCKA|nr:MAG: hypothetical protein COV25_03730 [candidate division WWE3 bacterium CG10_big_fil_rev_8_21_14_0_10_35_32]PJC23498.1 MAG: hypothetical protein CO058_03240 [candidate division WWE3 bacterium CG_4_9_14_0_2_um_filter_35_11]